MISKSEVDELEVLIGQLFSLHTEMTGLTKKSATDAVNAFKLKLINKTLSRCNALLGDAYKPFKDFAAFDSDDVPSNSDVTLMVGQYQEAIEYFRSEHIALKHGAWYYVLPEGESAVRTSSPVRLTKRS
jgi:hypothetical protein